MHELSTEDLELLASWYKALNASLADDYDLYKRICAELTLRDEMENFVSDCGDSCKL